MTSNAGKTSQQNPVHWKTRAVLTCFKSLRAVLRLFSPETLERFARFVAPVARLLTAREVKFSTTQIRFALSDAKVKENLNPDDITKGVYQHVGTMIAEGLALENFLCIEERATSEDELPRFKHIEVEHPEEVLRTLQHDKATIALSGHIGAFELLASYFVAIGGDVCVFGRRPNYEIFSHVLEEFRDGNGMETIWRDEPRSAAKLLRALKRGAIFAALIDQDTRLESEFSNFFGLEAASPLAPINLAIKYDLRLVTSFIVRTGHASHLISHEPIVFDKDDPDAAKYILDTYNNRLQCLIARYPDQWIWWHRRWRRRPGVDYQAQPEQLRSTDDYLSWLEHNIAAKVSGAPLNQN